MTAKIAQLRAAAPLVPAVRSPERQRLAEAIERCQTAAETLNRAREAKTKLDRLWYAADAEIAAAKVRLSDAREAEPRRLVARLIDGGGAGDGPELQAAIASLAKAEGKLKAIDATTPLIEGDILEAKDEQERAQDALSSAVAGVLCASPEVAAAIEAMNSARERFEDAFAVVYALERVSGAPRRDNGVGGRLSWLLAPNLNPHNTASSILWRAAIAALRTNAAAPLPTAPSAR